MSYVNAVLLALSVALSACRNIFSKGIAGFPFGSKSFYYAQAVIFLFGTVTLAVFGGGTVVSASALTIFYAFIYAVLLISAQWCYTAALKNGNTAICSTVYSMGFIFPTLSGALFWEERLTIFRICGILAVIPAVVVSGMRNKAGGTHENYILPLVLAMLSSGGLGVMQKVQQSSPYAEQKSVFVLIAFAAAGLISLIFAASSKNLGKKMSRKKLLMSQGAGVCFGGCNLLNTTLAGRLDSAVFFPLQNISVILLSMALGVCIFKEKPGKKEFIVLLLGVAAVIFLSV